LTLLGLVALEDPPCHGAADALAACRRAGIGVAMITGDHRATARAIAAEVGLLRPDAVVAAGADLPVDDDELGALIDRDGTVVARVSPKDKLRIARVLGRRGHVVAMTATASTTRPRCGKHRSAWRWGAPGPTSLGRPPTWSSSTMTSPRSSPPSSRAARLLPTFADS
jgi:high-affinity K+ transport system ATPase subunit B